MRHSVKAKLSVVGTIAAIALASAASLNGAQAQDRTIMVSVMDGTGGPVGDMKQDEFVVKEGDATLAVTKVERASAPIHYAILVDTTPAASKAVIDIREALTAFCELLLSADPNTKFSIVEFGGASMTTLDFTSEMPAVEAAILKLVPKPSESVLNEAIMETAKRMESLPEGSRKVILTINMEPTKESSSVHPRQVADAVRKSGASMWSVALQDGSRRDANREQVLKGLTSNAGGRWVALQNQKQLAGFLRSIAANSFAQYAVTYSRTSPATDKTITDVSLTRPGVVALSLKWNPN